LQAFLIDGLARWNAARATAALATSASPLRSFNVPVQDKLNQLTKEILGEPFDPNYRPPSIYTGELFGIDYLYSETEQFPSLEMLEAEIEKGMDDAEEDIYGRGDGDPSVIDEMDPELDLACSAFSHAVRSDEEEDDGDVAMDWKGIPGWNQVFLLASFIVTNASYAITDSQANMIVKL